VVIKLVGEQDPYRVLSWQDDVAVATSRPQKLAGDDDDL
jgi:general secretion pathway protein K